MIKLNRPFPAERPLGGLVFAPIFFFARLCVARFRSVRFKFNKKGGRGLNEINYDRGRSPVFFRARVSPSFDTTAGEIGDLGIVPSARCRKRAATRGAWMRPVLRNRPPERMRCGSLGRPLAGGGISARQRSFLIRRVKPGFRHSSGRFPISVVQLSWQNAAVLIVPCRVRGYRSTARRITTPCVCLPCSMASFVHLVEGPESFGGPLLVFSVGVKRDSVDLNAAPNPGPIASLARIGPVHERSGDARRRGAPPFGSFRAFWRTPLGNGEITSGELCRFGPFLPSSFANLAREPSRRCSLRPASPRPKSNLKRGARAMKIGIGRPPVSGGACAVLDGTRSRSSGAFLFRNSSHDQAATRTAFAFARPTTAGGGIGPFSSNFFLVSRQGLRIRHGRLLSRPVSQHERNPGANSRVRPSRDGLGPPPLFRAPWLGRAGPPPLGWRCGRA